MTRKRYLPCVVSACAFTFIVAGYAPLACAQPQAARVEIIDGAGRPVPSDILLIRGRTKMLAAIVHDATGAPMQADVTWSTDASGALGLTSVGGGTVAHALKDAFDDPAGAEPRGTVQACAGPVCASITVTCIVDLSGTWDGRLDVALFPVTAHRALTFVQDGRFVRFTYDPGQTATVRVDGRSVSMVSGGGDMQAFAGRLTGRGSASGDWSASGIFAYGTWNAVRR